MCFRGRGQIRFLGENSKSATPREVASRVPQSCNCRCFIIVTALANTVGSAVQVVESVVRAQAVRRGRPASAHQKARESGRAVRQIRRPGPEVRNRHAGYDGISLFPAKGIYRYQIRSIPWGL